MALCLSTVCQPSMRDISLTEKRGTHHVLLTILRAIPTCRPLLPYAPKLDMVLQIVALTSLLLQNTLFLEVEILEDKLYLQLRKLSPCV